MSSTLAMRFAAALIALCVSATGQNLVHNAKFDNDVSSWSLQSSTAGYTRMRWNWLDAHGSMDSGSVQVTNDAEEAGIGTDKCCGSAVLGDCVAVTPGAPLTLSAKRRFPPSQGASGNAWVFVTFFKDSGCRTPSNILSWIGPPASPGGDYWDTTELCAGSTPCTGPPQTVPADARAARVGLEVGKNEAHSQFAVLFDDVYLGAGAVAQQQRCSVDSHSLCLNQNRFRVTASWKDFENRTGTGTAVSMTSDTGYFWFFNSANVELVVKVVDGRGLNGKFWVFYGALSNVEYTIQVTDTATGATKSYFNPSGQFGSRGDTDAFAESAPPPPASGEVTEQQRRELSQALFEAISDAFADRPVSWKWARPNTLINIPLSAWSGCEEGGHIEVSGNVSGSLDDRGSGALLIDARGTVTDCRVGGVVFNGDPYVSFSGTFSFLNAMPSTQQYIRIGGGIKPGCSYNNATINLSLETGGGTLSGTICGSNVYYSF